MTDPIVVEVLNWAEDVIGEPVCYNGVKKCANARVLKCASWNAFRGLGDGSQLYIASQ